MSVYEIRSDVTRPIRGRPEARSCRTTARVGRKGGASCSSPCRKPSGPVGFLAFGGLGPEVDVIGGIGIRDRRGGVDAAQPRELLVGLQHSPRLVVVDRVGPEVLCRHVWRHLNLVGLAAIHGIAVLVQVDQRILRSRTSSGREQSPCLA